MIDSPERLGRLQPRGPWQQHYAQHRWPARAQQQAQAERLRLRVAESKNKKGCYGVRPTLPPHPVQHPPRWRCHLHPGSPAAPPPALSTPLCRWAAATRAMARCCLRGGCSRRPGAASDPHPHPHPSPSHPTTTTLPLPLPLPPHHYRPTTTTTGTPLPHTLTLPLSPPARIQVPLHRICICTRYLFTPRRRYFRLLRGALLSYLVGVRVS